MSELDVLAIIKSAYYEKTNENIPMIFDIISGRKTTEVSGFPTSYKPGRKETMILDLLPKYKGVYADNTRTYFINEPEKKQEEIYEIICMALKEAEKVLKPGKQAKEIYQKIMDVFGDYHLSKYFTHHAGHGFGQSIYEAPYFLNDEKEVLEENMVVTLEPGLYLPDAFGIRLENNYVLTREGNRSLNYMPVDIDNYLIGV